MKLAGAGWEGMRAVATALPVAREPALSRTRPVPRAPRLADDRAVVRAPAVASGRPQVVAAASTTPGPLRPASAGAPARIARQPVAVWLGAGLLFAAVLQAIGLLAWRDVPIAFAPAWSDEESLPEEPPAAGAEEVPEPGPQALAEAINAELQRVGVDAQVSLAGDRTAIVSGRVNSAAERDSLLEWLRSVPGVADVDDRLELPPEPAPPPPPRAIAPPAARAPVARPEVPAPPVVVAPPRPAPAAPPAEVARVAPAPPAAPAATEPAAAPSAEAIARSLQRELARLALPDVSAEVDPATLQITLRGRTHDAARKAQALAAARAANPGGRVRDLVFLVEE